MTPLLRRPLQAVLLSGACLLGVAGCASLPSQEGRVASHAITNLGDSRLHALATERPAGVDASHSGVLPLADPLQAFGARVLLARRAATSLDVQYYIWHPDTTGTLMLKELWDAAQRGVRVRLLLDDNGIGGMDPLLGAFDSHANAEVRLFNPFMLRTFKSLNYLTQFSRLNHRMHNKSFTADASATIVGGRNLGDEYFGANADTLVADLDVMAVGQAAGDVTTAFDAYWNSASAYPFDRIVEGDGRALVPAMEAAFAAMRESAAAKRYSDAVVAGLLAADVQEWRDRLDWVPMQLVCDPPEKILDKARPADLMMAQLMEAFGGARESLDIVSPYFVPGKQGAQMLGRIAQSSVRVRVLTNSLVSGDHAVVYAGYTKRRDDMLRDGIRVYEMKPLGSRKERKAQHKKYGAVSGSSVSMLHTKTFALDRRKLFVGSFNLDLRSINLNTEMGLVMEAPGLTGQLVDTLERRLPEDAWEVRLQADGHGVEWVERKEGVTETSRKPPQAGLLLRIGVRLMSWLPIEGLL